MATTNPGVDSSASDGTGSNGGAASLAPLAIIGLLFFAFGFVTWLNGSLIPFLKLICHLSFLQALLVTFSFYIAYTVMALPMSAILARIGYRNGMALGLGIMAVAAIMQIPAAWLASFPLFLLALFTMGTGLTILQTAANPYIVLLGPLDRAAQRISLMGIVNKAAGIVVPAAFTSVIVGNVGDLNTLTRALGHGLSERALAARLVVPYCAIAIVLLGLVALVRLAPLPEVSPRHAEGDSATSSLWHHPQLILGTIALFGYMGLEVLAGDTIGLFGMKLGVANYTGLTSFTMAFMVLGYVVGIALIPRVVSQRAALAGCGASGFIASIGILFAAPGSSALSSFVWGWSGIAGIPDPVFLLALLGFLHALVWPTLWPLALSDLGAATARGSAMLIMAISGGALIPLLFGWIATRTGNVQGAYAIALPCYAMILFYALVGSRMRRWPLSAA